MSPRDVPTSGRTRQTCRLIDPNTLKRWLEHEPGNAKRWVGILFFR